MTERERLIELLCCGTQKTEICTKDTFQDCRTARGDCGYCTILADHLLSNGVIVPPCKVGDTVYFLYWFKGKKIGSGTIEEIYYNGDSFAYHIYIDGIYRDFQHDEVYFTREEADEALKEREQK